MSCTTVDSNSSMPEATLPLSSAIVPGKRVAYVDHRPTICSQGLQNIKASRARVAYAAFRRDLATLPSFGWTPPEALPNAC